MCLVNVRRNEVHHFKVWFIKISPLIFLMAFCRYSWDSISEDGAAKKMVGAWVPESALLTNFGPHVEIKKKLLKFEW